MIHVDTARRLLTFEDLSIPCTIGRSGACPAADKREGDGCTPLGVWRLETALFRSGRTAPPPGLALPWRWLNADDGWSDDPADPAYNRPVRHPHRFSAERLVRDDGLYDVIVTLDHNSRPPVPGHGSAIFLHCRNGDRPTEGCVAIEKAELLALLPRLAAGEMIAIA